jgi:putative peptidoglycan lipid II flippase
VAVGLFLVTARLMRIHEVSEAVATLLRRRGDSKPETLETREEAAIEASGDRFAESGSSGDSPTVIRPPSPSIEGAGEESAKAMVQATAAQGVGKGGEELRAATLPAGTVLASRYRLEELIGESQPTVTWRAFDQVLSRSVLVHLLAPGDPGADELLTAARKASVATDSRFLRVLDAVHSIDPAVGSYIVCEYATGQSLEMILSHGPLSGLEAAWITREVADALAGVHSLGLYHRRISPETVIITPSGNVKIVGLLIEAALRPSPTDVVPGANTPELMDVTDLGRLLYASLVCRWPGGQTFGLPSAPTMGRRWMTPRQVRAGVPPALDNVCDQILGDPPRHHAPAIIDAGGIVTALTKVLGSADAAPDLERRLRQPIPSVGGGPQAAETSANIQPVSSLLDQTSIRQEAIVTRTIPAASAPPTTQQTRISISRRSGPAPTTGRSSGPAPASRSPRTRPPAPQPATQQRQRRWIGLLLVLAVLLIAAGIISAIILDRRLSGAIETSTSSNQSGTSERSPAQLKKLTITQARDFDPQGEDKTENPDEVSLAYDGDPATRWRTVQYFSSPKLGNLKRGVGLVLDLGGPQPVRSVQLSLSGAGTTVEFRVPLSDPALTTTPPMSSDNRWRTVTAEPKAAESATLTAEQAVTTRYVLVYLTSLPKEGNGYRGGIYEVEVLQ